MSELPYPEWQEPFQDALSETDKQKLQAKVHLASGKSIDEWKQFPPMATTMKSSQRLPTP